MPIRMEYRFRGLPNLPLGLPRLKPALPPDGMRRSAAAGIRDEWMDG